MAENTKFTILSFVGGGIRGLMSVTILNELYTKFPHILDNTDLIAGCSTGSIITSELLGGNDAAGTHHLLHHAHGQRRDRVLRQDEHEPEGARVQDHGCLRLAVRTARAK